MTVSRYNFMNKLMTLFTYFSTLTKFHERNTKVLEVEIYLFLQSLLKFFCREFPSGTFKLTATPALWMCVEGMGQAWMVWHNQLVVALPMTHTDHIPAGAGVEQESAKMAGEMNLTAI